MLEGDWKIDRTDDNKNLLDDSRTIKGKLLI